MSSDEIKNYFFCKDRPCIEKDRKLMKNKVTEVHGCKQMPTPYIKTIFLIF